MAWYNSSWLYRVKISIEGDEVGSTLTNFPVYVDLSTLPAGFHTNVKSDGSDIRVTSSDGETELAREVVAYDSGTDTGELHFLAPSISSSLDTEFYIYYGNSAATDYAPDATYGAENVWVDYLYVSHDGGLVDSTGNLTPTNYSTSTVTGKVGQARSFNGSSQYVDLNTTSLLNSETEATVQAWVKLDSSVSRDHPIISKWNSSGWVFWVDDATTSPSGFTDTVAFAPDAGATDNGRVNGTTGIVSASTWYLFHGTFDASSYIRLYRNGSLNNDNTTSVISSFASTGHDTYVGNSPHVSNIKWFEGDMDELRITNIARPTDWIYAEYSNQETPTTFYTLGSQETNSEEVISTYYFDGHADLIYDDYGWTDPENAYDGDPDTFAYHDTASENLGFAGTTAPTSGTTISQVRARVKAVSYNFGSIYALDYDIYNGVHGLAGGDTQTTYGSPAYTDWIILTEPGGGWTWEMLSTDLYVDLYVFRSGGFAPDVQAGASIVEIEVTHQGVVTDTYLTQQNGRLIRQENGRGLLI